MMSSESILILTEKSQYQVAFLVFNILCMYTNITFEEKQRKSRKTSQIRKQKHVTLNWDFCMFLKISCFLVASVAETIENKTLSVVGTLERPCIVRKQKENYSQVKTD